MSQDSQLDMRDEQDLQALFDATATRPDRATLQRLSDHSEAIAGQLYDDDAANALHLPLPPPDTLPSSARTPTPRTAWRGWALAASVAAVVGASYLLNVQPRADSAAATPAVIAQAVTSSPTSAVALQKKVAATSDSTLDAELDEELEGQLTLPIFSDPLQIDDDSLMAAASFDFDLTTDDLAMFD